MTLGDLLGLLDTKKFSGANISGNTATWPTLHIEINVEHGCLLVEGGPSASYVHMTVTLT